MFVGGFSSSAHVRKHPYFPALYQITTQHMMTSTDSDDAPAPVTIPRKNDMEVLKVFVTTSTYINLLGTSFLERLPIVVLETVVLVIGFKG